MKVSALLGSAALALVLTATAYANGQGTPIEADVPVQQPPVAAAAEAPPAPAPDFAWEGFYLGGHLGYAQMSGDFDLGSNSCVHCCEVQDLDSSGLIGGLQAGYNWRSGDWIFGVEADVSAVGISETSNNIVLNGVPSTRPSSTLAMDWKANLAPRVGILAGSTLIYAKAGLALAGVEVGHNTNSGSVYSSETGVRVGWMAGAGVEFELADNLTGKLEYNYQDYGTETYEFPSFRIEDEARAHTVFAGVNYHFGN